MSHEHTHHDHDHPFGHGRPGRGRGRRDDMMRSMRGGEGGGGWGGPRRRMRRGDIRRAILGSLIEGPAHGYEVMRRLEVSSGGLWRPSPGSVYPTLQMLEDEGLIQAVASEGTRTFELTEAGRTEATQSVNVGEGAPWDHGDENADRVRNLRSAVGQVALAGKQVASAGLADQIDRATEVVQRARKELYQILAED